MTELSDELLVAYVDGQLARAQTKAVEKVLKHDDVIARRVDALKEAHAKLEAAFEAILAGEVSDLTLRAEPRLVVRETVGPSKIRLAFAGLVLVAASAAAGYFAPVARPQFEPLPNRVAKQSERVRSTWQDDAANAHALLTRESLEVGLDSQGNRDLVVFQLANALGQDLKLPDLEPQGFKFVRGQLLNQGAQPLAQMLYLGKTGGPLALYARRGEGDQEPRFSEAGTVGLVSWTERGMDYLLAGDDDESMLLGIASKIRYEPLAPTPVPPPPVPSSSAAEPAASPPTPDLAPASPVTGSPAAPAPDAPSPN